jgi:hypothetical protein
MFKCQNLDRNLTDGECLEYPFGSLDALFHESMSQNIKAPSAHKKPKAASRTEDASLFHILAGEDHTPCIPHHKYSTALPLSTYDNINHDNAGVAGRVTQKPARPMNTKAWREVEGLVGVTFRRDALHIP